MRIVMLGPPASGKGTQGKRLATELGIPHVSSGQLLRASMRHGDPLGVGAIVATGALVPDRLVERLLLPALGSAFVLDGYPRTRSQAERLDAFLLERDLPLDAPIELLVDDGTLATRMRLRSRAEDRVDDRPEVFLRRIAEYRRAVDPLRDHYGPRLLQVDGMGDPDEVHHRLLKALARAADGRE